MSKIHYISDKIVTFDTIYGGFVIFGSHNVTIIFYGLTRRKKRDIVALENGKDEETSLPTPAQRGCFTGCKSICHGSQRLPLPSCVPKEGTTGPPVTEATSGSFGKLQAGWNRGIQILYPTPDQLRGGILFISPQF